MRDAAKEGAWDGRERGRDGGGCSKPVQMLVGRSKEGRNLNKTRISIVGVREFVHGASYFLSPSRPF
jgi:hypothetical protein